MYRRVANDPILSVAHDVRKKIHTLIMAGSVVQAARGLLRFPPLPLGYPQFKLGPPERVVVYVGDARSLSEMREQSDSAGG